MPIAFDLGLTKRHHRQLLVQWEQRMERYRLARRDNPRKPTANPWLDMYASPTVERAYCAFLNQFDRRSGERL